MVLGGALLLLPPPIKGWVLMPPAPKNRRTECQPSIIYSSRFDELVGMDAGMETPSPVDDRYYSVPPTQPQLLINAKPRITLTRFLSNIVKEDPEVSM